MSFLRSLDPMIQTFWIIAVCSTLVLSLKYARQRFAKKTGKECSVSQFFEVDNKEGEVQNGFSISFSVFLLYMLCFSWCGLLLYTFLDDRLWILSLAVVLGFLPMFFSRFRKIV